METYSNSESGVAQYNIGDNYIDVRFKGGRTYRYSDSTCGEDHLFAMKVLALNNDDLNTYINIHHPGFEGEKKLISKQPSQLFAINPEQPITENKKEKIKRGNSLAGKGTFTISRRDS